jgi:integrase
MNKPTNEGSSTAALENQSIASIKSVPNSINLSDASLKGRESVWNRFLLRLEESGTPIDRASPSDLKAIAFRHRHGDHPKEHSVRVLEMARSAIDELQANGFLPKGENAGRVAIATLNETLRNDQTFIPSLIDLSLFIRYIENENDNTPFCARDRAIFALCLGSGATPTAISLATVSCIKNAATTGKITLKSISPTKKRPSIWEAPILKFSQNAIQRWADTLDLEHTEPAFLGKKGTPVSRSQVFRIIKKQIEFCHERFPGRSCPQSLRNGYFGLLLEEELSNLDVKRAMGWSLSDGEQLRRMTLIWKRGKTETPPHT